jgi:hypothetical protein
MSRSVQGQGERGRWILAITGALMLGIVIVTLIRPPSVVQRIEPVIIDATRRVELTKVVRGEAALLDKTPLFLPTEWNTAQKEIYLPQSGGAFSDYAPKFAYDEAELRPLKPAELSVFSVTDALALAPPGPELLGFGRSELKSGVLEKRGAFVEIVEAKGGLRVLGRGLSEAQPPATADWVPLEFLATVDAAGLTGPLVLTARSGVDEVDSYFQKYLTQKLRIGVLLGPGIYRICVGP